MKSSRDFQTVEARIRPESADDEIVISGISGKFPKAGNMAEFAHNLYNKVNKMRRFFFGSHIICNECKSVLTQSKSDVDVLWWMNNQMNNLRVCAFYCADRYGWTEWKTMADI